MGCCKAAIKVDSLRSLFCSAMACCKSADWICLFCQRRW
ncbi:Uncharacterised protein [Vibrio cholerae]|nr:Uncharacterised protein [Vibrio cholerae]